MAAVAAATVRQRTGQHNGGCFQVNNCLGLYGPDSAGQQGKEAFNDIVSEMHTRVQKAQTLRLQKNQHAAQEAHRVHLHESASSDDQSPNFPDTWNSKSNGTRTPKVAKVKGYTKNFRSLLSQLDREHERVVSSLRKENLWLRDKLNLSGSYYGESAQSWHTLNTLSSNGEEAEADTTVSSRFQSKLSLHNIPSSHEAGYANSGIPVVKEEKLRESAIDKDHRLPTAKLLEVTFPEEKPQVTSAMQSAAAANNQEQVELLRMMFKVDDPEGQVILASDLTRVLAKRMSTQELDNLDVEAIMIELQIIYSACGCVLGSRTPSNKLRRSMMDLSVVSYTAFETLMLMPELRSLASPSMANDIDTLQSTLLPRTDELSAVLKNQGIELEQDQKEMNKNNRVACILRVVQIVTTLTTLASTMVLGFSLDFSPDWDGWLALEIFCAFVFASEVVIKMALCGFRAYFRGSECSWNVLDLFLATLAVVDVVISFVAKGQGVNGSLYAVFRVFRLARLARLVKLIRIPLLSELASMVSAIVLSAPWLFWVIIILTITVYMCAVIMRTGVGSIMRDDFDECGDPDYINPNDQTVAPQCKLHWLYGKEYCSSTVKCALTIFRCFTGECTSSTGRSLIAIFSAGWGFRFDLAYCAVMAAVIFGLFNVITATFIEATLSGLKSSEKQRKYSRLEDRSYIKSKVRELTDVIMKVAEKRRLNCKRTVRINELTAADVSAPAMRNEKEIFFTEGDFDDIIKDREVRHLLEDLDIVVEPRRSSFEAFDVDDDKQLSLEELVGGLLRVRGEFQKLDIVSVQLSLISIREHVDALRAQSLDNQSRMMSLMEVLSQNTTGA